MNKAWIVIKEVYRKNVLSWSFFFMVISPILMIGLFGGFGYLIAQDQMSSSVGEIAVVDADSDIQEIIATQGGESESNGRRSQSSLK